MINFKPKIKVINHGFNYFKKFITIVTKYGFILSVARNTNLDIILKHGLLWEIFF